MIDQWRYSFDNLGETRTASRSGVSMVGPFYMRLSDGQDQ